MSYWPSGWNSMATPKSGRLSVAENAEILCRMGVLMATETDQESLKAEADVALNSATAIWKLALKAPETPDAGTPR